jgi:hypothetical protein
LDKTSNPQYRKMARTTRTRDKLDEARFFLRLCEDNRHLREFNYYLSACVSAARAVTWIMHAEYLRVEGWQAWFKARTPSEDEERLLRQMRDIRNRSQKTAPLDARAAVQVNIPPELLTEELRAKMAQWRVGTRFRFAVTPLPAEDSPYPGVPVAPEFQMPEDYPKDAFVGTVEGFERWLDDIPEEEIVKAVGRYIGHLEDLVIDCEAAFRLA